MCEFPSWIVTPDGKAHFLLDRDIKQAVDDEALPSWDDATGHSAIEMVLGVKGKHVEGREGLPVEFASAIRAGQCNRMARVEPVQAIKHVMDLLPPGLELWGDEYSGSLDLRGCTLPEGLKLPAKCGSLYLSGCMLRGKSVSRMSLDELREAVK